MMTTREKILNAAQDLIQTRSFHGFSFQDLADRVGIRKPSLYHYFDSKDAIALAVLERAADWVRAQMAKVDGEDPATRLESVFSLSRNLRECFWAGLRAQGFTEPEIAALYKARRR